MATLSTVILPAKALKGGRHKVRISVAHNGDTRYILTDIILDSVKEFKNGQVVKRPDAAALNVKLRGLLQRVQTAIDGLEYTNGLTCPELIYQIKHYNEQQHRSLQSLFDERLKIIPNKPRTVKLHKQAWKAITESVKPGMLAENVRPATILHLEAALRKRGLSEASIHAYINVFKAVVNYGVRAGYVRYNVPPFAMYKMPAYEVRKAWLTPEQIKLIRDAELPEATARGRDIFMLSFYLGGINIVDLMKFNFKKAKGVLKYVRTKTERQNKVNKYVEFTIPEEAQEIIDRLVDKEGYIYGSKSQRETRYSYFLQRTLKVIEKKTGIEKIIFYSARKTFSQMAFDLGVSTAVIDYILGHKLDGKGTSLFSYISVTPQMATDAVRKVLDSLK